MARSDPYRVHVAKLTGAAAGLRDHCELADPDAVAAQRAALPRVWEFIDRLRELA